MREQFERANLKENYLIKKLNICSIIHYPLSIIHYPLSNDNSKILSILLGCGLNCLETAEGSKFIV